MFNHKTKQFINLCKMTQGQLHSHLVKELKKNNYTICEKKGDYIYATGSIPVLLTAHIDTVHTKPVKRYNINGNRISSPQGIGGDDRCGVYIILSIIKETQLKPHILFCWNEEVGGLGSETFAKTELCKNMDAKFMLELDRHGNNDCVFYDENNQEFIKWIQKETGFKENWGSFSDIGNLSPANEISSVNLSVGYYNEHGLNEYVVLSETDDTKDIVIHLLKKAKEKDTPYFKYEEKTYRYNYGKYGYYGWYDDYDSGYNSIHQYLFEFIDINGNEGTEIVEGYSLEECVGIFLMENPSLCWNNVLDYYKI